VAQQMKKNGWDYTKDQPDMVQWKGEEYQTLDHRRLVAAKQAGLAEVGAEVHPPTEALPADQVGRFVSRRTFTDPETGIAYRAGQIAKTWGEAALFRAANQGADFPLRGSSELPRITGQE
jgi:hypothetical protein